jgi:hypothetical protein
MGRFFRHLAGWGLLVLGTAGLVLPILQGWLMIATGALLLAPDMPVFARLLARIEQRVPALGRALRTVRGKSRGAGATPEGSGGNGGTDT